MDGSTNGSATTLQLQELNSSQTDNRVHPSTMGDGPMSDQGECDESDNGWYVYRSAFREISGIPWNTTQWCQRTAYWIQQANVHHCHFSNIPFPALCNSVCSHMMLHWFYWWFTAVCTGRMHLSLPVFRFCLDGSKYKCLVEQSSDDIRLQTEFCSWLCGLLCRLQQFGNKLKLCAIDAFNKSFNVHMVQVCIGQ